MAEDIKIDEVQQVKDAAYITVVLADGSLGKIAKVDLVELIRINMATATNEYKGLMGTSDLKNLSGLISDNNNINADNLPNGFYRYHQENYNEYNYPAAHGCILTIITDCVLKHGRKIFISDNFGTFGVTGRKYKLPIVLIEKMSHVLIIFFAPKIYKVWVKI